jgi:predicted metal-dependent HD superfamily phosphohydrolase
MAPTSKLVGSDDHRFIWHGTLRVVQHMAFVFFTEHRWHSLWSTLGADAPAGSFNMLLERYSEPHRRYHDARHIDRCLLHFDALKSFAQRPELVELALWLHDAVYDTRSHDNEERSTDLAEALLESAGLHHLIDPVRAMIMGTRHQEACLADDVGLVVDIDLSVLGSSQQEYLAYVQQIREEYSWVPDHEFRDARIKVLKTIAGHPMIYSHEPCFTMWECKARGNLQVEMVSLNDF